jgi:pyruvate formate lyase activating enzyme
VERGKCGWCVRDCPEGGAPIVFGADDRLAAIRETPECLACHRCAEACPSRAIKTWGEEYTVGALMKIILQDRGYYERTGGGVTLSGGEPLLQAEFCAGLLSECRRERIHTCAETAFNVPWDDALKVFEFTDLIITDVKHTDAQKHREYCGAGNALIFENIRKASKLGIPLVIRTPVIPGYNADEANLRASAEFIASLGSSVAAWQLLPYRKMGTEKYASLGIEYPLGDYEPPERAVWEAELLRLQAVLSSEYGVPVVAGSADALTL